MPGKTGSSTEASERAMELAALARLVTYARQTADALDISLSAYCLDLALGSILEEMQDMGVDTGKLLASGARPGSREFH